MTAGAGPNAAGFGSGERHGSSRTTASAAAIISGPRFSGAGMRAATRITRHVLMGPMSARTNQGMPRHLRPGAKTSESKSDLTTLEAVSEIWRSRPVALLCENGERGGARVSVVFETLAQAQDFHRAIVALFNSAK